MVAIVPPNHTITNRKILRRPKAYRLSWCSVAFASLAITSLMVRFKLTGSLSIWVQWFAFASCGLALVASIGAVIFRIVETPREGSVADRWYWPRKNPPVIYVDRGN